MTKLRTIFRYPGGKTKLVDHIILRIKRMSGGLFQQDIRPFTFVDVFAGGGSVSLSVLNEFPGIKLILNDLDEYMYAFWKILCDHDKEEFNKLCSYVKKYDPPTVNDFNRLRNEIEDDNRPRISRKAYYAIFFNRTTFSGIFNSGPIGGFDQNGKYKINCRYNSKTINKWLEILFNKFQNNCVFCYNKDYTKLIKKFGQKNNVFLYLDPPYMKHGHVLYRHYMKKEQYQEMANLLKQCQCKWLLSHDDCPELIKMFAKWADIKTIEGVPYTINSIKGKRRSELLISKT